ncbi:glycosyl hydrolase [Leptospira sp. GIMC2001]|uniref:glycosyl hydrolase n=1 Tax=Leptospira sp. GIMC2001 TaxID=1513297 RepID=UPI00234BC7E1|nr:glycosyl hydrolase [Leptospira sp. GIMC2001]WCL49337.1 glycosyl hydrolase [Leptospira sp. GIMC2001]
MMFKKKKYIIIPLSILFAICIFACITLQIVLLKIRDTIIQHDDGRVSNSKLVSSPFDNNHADLIKEIKLKEFTKYNFELKDFTNPDFRFGPFARWWWPGNDVTPSQLKKEIQEFSEVGIAGVEIQPFIMGLNPKMNEVHRNRVYSWDTESYYDNLKIVMNEAKKKDMKVDLNSTGGWPTGGRHLTLDDNLLTLLHSEVIVSGGKKIQLKIEHPNPPFTSYLPGIIQMATGDNFLKGGKIYLNHLKLETVVAYKIEKNDRTTFLLQLNDQIQLNQKSHIILDNFISHESNILQWEAPEGNWIVIGFWSLPADESPVLIPTEETSYVVDHFDSDKVKNNYSYLFGDRTGLKSFYGNTFRGIFNDSYEFIVERHFSKDFFNIFETKRGYDIRPFLPANIIPAYNHGYGHILAIQSKPEFIFDQEDSRIVYDYDLTISELLEERFLKTSKEWMSKRGLVHRSQGYGLPMDTMKAAKYIDIPEAEHLYGEFSYSFLKLVSSGSFLYNKPLTSCESIVFIGRDYMSSPLKVKVALDKAFANGINHTIYHGSAYLYQNEDFGEEGWFPWSSPYSPMFGFSFDYRKTNQIWNAMTHINKYVKRVQYALQSGKPKKSTLVYFPFLGIGYQQGVSDPNEHLRGGYLDNLEPETIELPPGIPFISDSSKTSESSKWLHLIYKHLQVFHDQGIEWSWVNNDSILEAKFIGGEIEIRGNKVSQIIVADVPHIPIEVAEKLVNLGKSGARIIFLDKIPTKQPGYLNYVINDKKIQNLLNTAISNGEVRLLKNLSIKDLIIKGSDKIGSFVASSPNIQSSKRLMQDGSVLSFYANKSKNESKLRVNYDERIQAIFLLNVLDGTIRKLTLTQLQEGISIEGYGSRFILFSKNKLENKTYPNYVNSLTQLRSETIQVWDINIEGKNFLRSELFDWSERNETKYSSVGDYSAIFNLQNNDLLKKFIKISGFFHSLELSVNDKQVGFYFVPPYNIDITDFLKVGKNRIQIKAFSPLYNSKIGKGKSGDPHYSQFSRRNVQLMSTGILGPIEIISME